jgi:hypothetical protein
LPAAHLNRIKSYPKDQEGRMFINQMKIKLL